MHLPSEIIGVWIAAGLTLMMYSFLYKDNPLFRFGEHLYVGLTVGWGLCYAIFNIVWPNLIHPLYRVVTASFGKDWNSLKQPLDPSFENWWLLVPLFFSIFILTRFIPKIAWLSRWSFAFIMGTVSGMAIPPTVSADLFKQLVPTIQPLFQPGPNFWATLLNTSSIILILIGVITVLIYFFFSTEHKGVVNTISRVGVFYMMTAFGASFGYTVMARETLAIGRFQYLIKWGKAEYYYAPIIMAVVVIIAIILWEVFRHKQPPSEDRQPSA